MSVFVCDNGWRVYCNSVNKTTFIQLDIFLRITENLQKMNKKCHIFTKVFSNGYAIMIESCPLSVVMWIKWLKVEIKG